MQDLATALHSEVAPATAAAVAIDDGSVKHSIEEVHAGCEATAYLVKSDVCCSCRSCMA